MSSDPNDPVPPPPPSDPEFKLTPVWMVVGLLALALGLLSGLAMSNAWLR
jgi:hypothetical protein